MDNPFLVTGERGEAYLDTVKLAEALAPLVGGTVEKREPGAYGRTVIVMPDGLRLFVSGDYKAKRRAIISSYCPEELRQAAGRVSFPDATVDAGRPIDAIARDIKRRVVEPAAEPLAKVRERAEQDRKARESLVAVCRDLQRKFPTLRIDLPEGEAYQASFSAYGGPDGHVSGRISASGKVTIDRISSIGLELAETLFAALLPAPSEAGLIVQP